MSLFNKFANYALKYKDASIYDIYNSFISMEDNETQKFMTANYMLMLKVGEAARNAAEPIQKMFN